MKAFACRCDRPLSPASSRKSERSCARRSSRAKRHPVQRQLVQRVERRVHSRAPELNGRHCELPSDHGTGLEVVAARALPEAGEIDPADAIAREAQCRVDA
jgi:hypothetical protein